MHARLYQFCKRCMDMTISLLMLVLLSPVMLVTALAVKLTSPGPVFYRQERLLNRDGDTFAMLKFRSMIQNAEELEGELADNNLYGAGRLFKMHNDPRVTPLGRIIRKYSIDELPQLWQVLMGVMSLVGPRPIPTQLSDFEDWQLRRFDVKPGLTCTWQVSGRSDVAFTEWMRMDVEYVEHRGLLLDIKLLLQTIPAVLAGRGAY